MTHMGNNETVVLLQHIHSQLRNVYCVPAEVTYMKELKLMIDMQQKIDLDLEHISDTITAEDIHRMRCHTFDNGMNIPEEYKNTSDDGRAEIYRQFKSVVEAMPKSEINLPEDIDNTHYS